MQYVYGKYGRDRAGIVATVITYRSRSRGRARSARPSACRTTRSARSPATIWGWSNVGRRRRRCPPRRPRSGRSARIAQVLELSREIIGFPRHLSQHVGGFVITRSRLDEVVPILHAAMDDRTIIEWDKDDLDALAC